MFLVFNVLVERFFEKTAFSDAAINNDGDCDMSFYHVRLEQELRQRDRTGSCIGKSVGVVVPTLVRTCGIALLYIFVNCVAFDPSGHDVLLVSA